MSTNPTRRTAFQVVRDILGVLLGCVSFPFLVMAGHQWFAQMGVSEMPAGSAQDSPEAWLAFMEGLSTWELLSSSVAHIGGTFLAACLAMVIAGSRKRFPGIILGVFGLIGGVMNAFMLPGQPLWLVVLDIALYLPAGYLAGSTILALKARVA